MPKPFATEVALCAQFLALVDKRVWTAYAETGGWDILLSRNVDGFQIGIQAKLSLNLDVINQAIEQRSGWMAVAEGPDVRAVLVPGGTAKLGHVCDYLGLAVFVVQSPSVYSRPSFHPSLPAKPDQWNGHDDLHEWLPTKRHQLPEYVPDVAAGAPSPLQLTDWKIKAIKLAIILEKRTYVTREDFKHLSLDHRRWIANGWLEVPPRTKDSRPGFVAGGMPNLKKQHPRVYAEIAEKWEVWKPKEEKLL